MAWVGCAVRQGAGTGRWQVPAAFSAKGNFCKRQCKRHKRAGGDGRVDVCCRADALALRGLHILRGLHDFDYTSSISAACMKGLSWMLSLVVSVLCVNVYGCEVLLGCPMQWRIAWLDSSSVIPAACRKGLLWLSVCVGLCRRVWV